MSKPAPDLFQRRIKQFYIAATNRCNLRCAMCTTTTHQNETSEELSTEQWEAVIRNITRFNVESVGFGGGEPLLKADELSRLAVLVASQGITVNIVTNATLLDESFLGRVIDYKDKVIFLFSIEGMEEDNDRIRGKGVYAKIVKAARLLQSRRWPFFFTSVLMPQNFERYTGFLTFLMAHFPEVPLDIQPIIPHNEIYFLRNKFELNDAQLVSLRGILDFLHIHEGKIKLCRPLKIIDKYWDYFTNKLSSENPCKMGAESFNINYRGNLWICGKELEYPLYKHKLEDVLGSTEYSQEMERVARCKIPCLAGLVI